MVDTLHVPHRPAVQRLRVWQRLLGCQFWPRVLRQLTVTLPMCLAGTHCNRTFICMVTADCMLQYVLLCCPLICRFMTCRTTNPAGFIPFVGDGYALDLPSKWNPR